MNKVKIITDSNAGIHASDNFDVFVVPMPFLIDGIEYYEDINLSNEEFYDFST